MVSLQYGNFSPHLNAGYVHRGGTQQNDAILATIGFDHLMGRGATLAGDLITEWQVGASKLALPQPQTIYELAGSVLTPRFVRPTNIPDRRITSRWRRSAPRTTPAPGSAWWPTC